MVQSTRDGERLKKADRPNPNSFFSLNEIKTPLISDKSTIKAALAKEIFEYDLVTEKGKSYVMNVD